VFLFLKKIEDKKEKRLKKLVQSIKPKGFGVIVRTVAEGKK
jgi:ribonuclease G